MSKTPFSEKCFVLGGLWLYYRDEAESNDSWREFFSYNDISLPMAYFIADGLVSPSDQDEVERLIDETWTMLCNYLDVDPDAEYANIDDMFLSSPLSAASNE